MNLQLEVSFTKCLMAWQDNLAHSTRVRIPWGLWTLNLLKKDKLDLKLIEHDYNVILAKFAVSQIPGLLQMLSMHVAAVLTIEDLLLRLSNQKIRSVET